MMGEVDHQGPARHTSALPARLVLVLRDTLGSRAHPRGHLCQQPVLLLAFRL